MSVTFADVTLDAERMHLARAGEEVPVEPQVFEVLAYLVAHRNRMVPKTELLDEIWGDRFVSESALTSRIKSARRAIGDNGRDQRLIRTVHGRGFRFVGEVREAAEEGRPRRAADGEQAVDGVAAMVVAAVGAGRGLVVELVGPSGPARTDALEDIVHAASDAGLLVGRSGGVELRSIASVLTAFDEWVQRRPALVDDLPAGCATELQAVLGGAGPSSRQRLHLAARELVAAAGRSGGAVLAIDDVHLIDRTTLDLLEELVRAVHRVPVALVVTHRPDFHVAGDAVLVAVDERAGPDEAVPVSIRDALARVAVLGEVVDDVEFAAASGLADPDAARALEVAVASRLVERTAGGHRFVDADVAARLAAEVPSSTRREVLAATARRLEELDAEASRVADRFLAAGDLEAAAPHQLVAATAAARTQRHAEVLHHTERVDEVIDPEVRGPLLELRAGAAAGLGMPEAVRRYREAVRLAPPDRVGWLRARLGRVLMFAGDVESAAEALEGVEPDGSATDGGILLVQGMLAYFQGDLARADELAARSRELALAPGAPAQMLDAIALQGMIAHSRGEWFDRLRRELRFATRSNELVSTVFDAHVCVTQFLLYGPSGHDQVVQLAEDLQAAATTMGSPRAVGFALTLSGEAKLLAGHLDGARRDLTDAVRIHTEIGADTGRAHALQRLADVELAAGDRAEAERLCRTALPLARWSPLSRHLLQRLYGTLISAAPDLPAAEAVVEEARATLDGPSACELCQVTVSVPATMVLAAAGRLAEAEAELVLAERSASLWEGPAWPGAVDEARAALATARGDRVEAARLLRSAAHAFEAAHQPLGTARCLEALDD